MNRILLRNIMSMVFWLYTSIILAAPIEEVRHSVDEFREKNSEQRKQELLKMKEEISNTERLQRVSQERRSESDLLSSDKNNKKVRKMLERDNQQDNQQDEAVDNKALEAKRDIFKRFTSAHHQQEVVEFLRANEYGKIKGICKAIGIDDVLSKLQRGEEITKEDADTMLARLPRTLEEMQRKLGMIRISPDQVRVLTSLFNKVTDVLKQELPKKLSWDDIEKTIELISKPNDEIYKDLRRNVGMASYGVLSSDSRMVLIIGIVLLAINLIALILSVSKSSVANKIGKGIFITEGVLAFGTGFLSIAGR